MDLFRERSESERVSCTESVRGGVNLEVRPGLAALRVAG